MSTETAVKVPTLKASVLAKADLIQSALTVDNTTGIITPEADVYEKALIADGKSLEVANSYAEFDTDFIAGSVHAVGVIAHAAMSENKELQTAETLIHMAGKNTLDIEVERSHEYRNPKDKENPVIKHGVTDITYNVAADNGGAGQLKVARTLINNLFADSLK